MYIHTYMHYAHDNNLVRAVPTQYYNCMIVLMYMHSGYVSCRSWPSHSVIHLQILLAHHCSNKYKKLQILFNEIGMAVPKNM